MGLTINTPRGKTKMTLKVFFKNLIKLAVTREDLLPVENILLHIRMRGLKKATRTDRRKIVFLAFPTVWLMNLILFPFTVKSNQFQILNSFLMKWGIVLYRSNTTQTLYIFTFFYTYVAPRNV
jgi:hypothetical protein